MSIRGRLITRRAWTFFLLGLAVVSAAAAQQSTTLAGQALVDALRAGGYNIYFRHAATDWSLDDHVTKEGDWVSCDPDKMRQLASEGRRQARMIGEAMRALRIPVGRVLASPYCRTVATARLMELGTVETTTDVMNLRAAEYFGGRDAVAERARKSLSIPPSKNTNTVLVAHGNVVRAATGEYPREAGAIVFRPESDGGLSVIAHITAQQWARLATELADKR
jgi:phosphohistidine phosphatase SixA